MAAQTSFMVSKRWHFNPSFIPSRSAPTPPTQFTQPQNQRNPATKIDLGAARAATGYGQFPGPARHSRNIASEKILMTESIDSENEVVSKGEKEMSLEWWEVNGLGQKKAENMWQRGTWDTDETIYVSPRASWGKKTDGINDEPFVECEDNENDADTEDNADSDGKIEEVATNYIPEEQSNNEEKRTSKKTHDPDEITPFEHSNRDDADCTESHVKRLHHEFILSATAADVEIIANVGNEMGRDKKRLSQATTFTNIELTKVPQAPNMEREDLGSRKEEPRTTANRKVVLKGWRKWFGMCVGLKKSKFRTPLDE